MDADNKLNQSEETDNMDIADQEDNTSLDDVNASEEVSSAPVLDDTSQQDESSSPDIDDAPVSHDLIRKWKRKFLRLLLKRKKIVLPLMILDNKRRHHQMKMRMVVTGLLSIVIQDMKIKSDITLSKELKQWV